MLVGKLGMLGMVGTGGRFPCEIFSTNFSADFTAVGLLLLRIQFCIVHGGEREREREGQRKNECIYNVLANVRVLCVYIIEISMVDCPIHRGPIHTLSAHISTLYVGLISCLVKQHCRNRSNAYRAPNIHK